MCVQRQDERKMERLIRLVLRDIVDGDTRDPMSSALATTLETHLLQWVPESDVASLPWPAMTKSRAISHAVDLILKAPGSFLFQQRAQADDLQWSPAVERRVLLGQACTSAEALCALDKTLSNPALFVGAACRARFLQRRDCLCTGDLKSDLWVRGDDSVWRNASMQATADEGPGWRDCSSFASIPNSRMLIGLRGQTVLLGTLKAPSLGFQTSVRSPDMIDVELIPSGTIVVTLAKRNEDTGGCLQHETVAFRISDTNTLESVTLSPKEAADAEAAVQVREHDRTYDFSRVSCPLAARMVSSWKADIVLQEDIVFEDEGHGTVIGLVGHAKDFWVAHATGLVLHVKDGTIVSRTDLGLACTHAVGFPVSTRLI